MLGGKKRLPVQPTVSMDAGASPRGVPDAVTIAKPDDDAAGHIAVARRSRSLSRTASRLTSNYVALQERARTVAHTHLRKRRESMSDGGTPRGGGGSAVVHPEGVVETVSASMGEEDHACESYKYDGEESRIHFERRMELDGQYMRSLNAVILGLVFAIGILVAVIAVAQIIVAVSISIYLSMYLCIHLLINQSIYLSI